MLLYIERKEGLQ